MLDRKPLYAKIALARKQLGMDEASYRALLGTEFGVLSAKELNGHQLSRLVQVLAGLGATYTSQVRKQAGKTTTSTRPDWIEITDSMPYAQVKREITAIWRKLGYSMDSLNTRVKRAFGVHCLVWLHDFDQLSILLSDLQRREKAFDKKKAKALA